MNGRYYGEVLPSPHSMTIDNSKVFIKSSSDFEKKLHAISENQEVKKKDFGSTAQKIHASRSNDNNIEFSKIVIQTPLKTLNASMLKEEAKLKAESLLTCRICLEEGKEIQFDKNQSADDQPNPLICACKCKGSMAYVHHDCLKSWIFTNYTISTYKLARCELCMSRFMSYYNQDCTQKSNHKRLLKLLLIMLVLINLIYFVISTEVFRMKLTDGHFSFFLILMLDSTVITIIFMVLRKMRSRVLPLNKDQLKFADKRDPQYHLNFANV